MGRKQTFTDSELLDTTEALLLEHGYDGFHLKLLSEHLHGARSTIYQYYANKEEIVAACMKRVTMRTVQSAAEVDETDTKTALRQLMHLYARESKLHQLLSNVYKVKTASSAAAAKDVEWVLDAHNTLKAQLSRLFDRASKEGVIRSDVPLLVLMSVFFNLIETPNMMQMPAPQWGEMLFRVWLEGAQPQ